MSRAAVTASTPRLPAITPVGATSATPADATTAEAAGLSLNPFDWPGQLAGKAADDAAGAVWGLVQPFVLTSLFATAGIGLILIGALGIAKGDVQPLFDQGRELVTSAATKGAV